MQKYKLTNAQQPSEENDDDSESSAKPPDNPPPKITDKKQFKMASYDAYVESSSHDINSDSSFADFTHFPNETNVSIEL